ncbi:MAG: sulfurtransferase [Burkholderiales bacterium]
MPSLLVSTAQLAQHLTDPDWIVIDCRHNLADVEASRLAYQAAHILGAFFLHLDEDLAGEKTGRNGRHPLPDAQILSGKLGAIGIDQRKTVVAYDDAGSMFAVRLWWLLRWLGHENITVLDGGITKWLAEKRPVDAHAPKATPAIFKPGNGFQNLSADYVLQHLHHPDMLLIDARAPDRYAGQNETLDPVAGHIPGAMNRFFKNNLDANACFKKPEELKREFDSLLQTKSPRQVVHQCGSGVTACHNLFAMELAGLSGSKLYAGSWSEWCADNSRPVEK